MENIKNNAIKQKGNSEMPFDFDNLKPYDINYSNLFNQINRNKIFDTPDIQEQYLTAWYNFLKRHDKLIVDQLNGDKAIREYEMIMNSQPEIYQHSLNYPGTQVLLHFRVSWVNEVINKEKPKSSPITIGEFVREDSIYQWNPVKANVCRYLSANTPIIIVPFYDRQYELLVIDGNHRLTYKTQNNIPEIDALIISEQSVINYSLFSSSFDKFYYIMHNEIYYMVNEKKENNTNDYNLINKSFLHNGVIRFM